jgi:hypothetical protein
VRRKTINGDLNFKNLFATKNFLCMRSLVLTSSYDDLIVILPNILEQITNFFKKLGRFTASGTANVSTTAVEADFYMVTALGIVSSNLEIQK